ncbi:hypothetical protein V8C40DRAFT_248010 [Trichoderma camerunense]
MQCTSFCLFWGAAAVGVPIGSAGGIVWRADNKPHMRAFIGRYWLLCRLVHARTGDTCWINMCMYRIILVES